MCRSSIKIIFVLITWGFFGILMEAQDNQMKTQDEVRKKFLLHSEKLELSTFFGGISPGTSFSSLNGQMANIYVFWGGLIVNEKFAVSYFTATSPEINLISAPEYGTPEYQDWIEAGVELERLSSSAEFVYVNFKYSGLKLEYLHRTERVLFWELGIAAGFLGGLTLSENKTFLGLFNKVIYDEPVVTLNPQVGLGINLLPWWRIHLNAGYRFLGADRMIMDAADADSFTFSLGFSFGKFGN